MGWGYDAVEQHTTARRWPWARAPAPVIITVVVEEKKNEEEGGRGRK